MKFLIPVFATALCTLSFQAQAAPLHYKFTAEVSSITNDFGGMSAASLGSLVTGEFTYDPSEIATSTTSNVGYYSNPAASISASFAGHTISSAASQIQTYDNQSSFDDGFNISDSEAGDAGTGVGYSLTGYQVFLASTNLSLYNSTSLPGSLTLSDFDKSAFFYFGGRGTRDFSVKSDFLYANLTSLELVTAVPLPAALPLLTAGLGFLGFVGWRRKRIIAWQTIETQ